MMMRLEGLTLPPIKSVSRGRTCAQFIFRMCMSDEAPTTDQLLGRAAAGEAAAWGTLLTAHQERLMRMVAFRMDQRLRGRIDAADIVQEAFVEASEHREDYFRAQAVPLFLWLRG